MQATAKQRKCQNKIQLSDFCECFLQILSHFMQFNPFNQFEKIDFLNFSHFHWFLLIFVIFPKCVHSLKIGTKNAIRGMIIGISLAIFSAFTGLSVLVTYTVDIFQSTHTPMNAHLCAIALGIMQILGCLCSTQLSDTLGRKIMLIASFLGTTLGTAILIAFLYMQSLAFDVSAFSWIPVTTLSFVIFIISAGINPLLGVCTVENLPSKVYK